jgi:hypothetical protein
VGGIYSLNSASAVFKDTFDFFVLNIALIAAMDHSSIYLVNVLSVTWSVRPKYLQ